MLTAMYVKWYKVVYICLYFFKERVDKNPTAELMGSIGKNIGIYPLSNWQIQQHSPMFGSLHV